MNELVDCWVEVTNAGGAAGFPFPPVSETEVLPVLRHLVDGLDPITQRLIIASSDDGIVGWVTVERDLNRLVAHWGVVVRHLQVRPSCRGVGTGEALMQRCRDTARTEMGLEQLHLSARSGQGLEEYYTRLGWTCVGSWPNALRLSSSDTRSEVLFQLAPL
ncbi:GNAT family N-acetyltransferase [Pseudonocardia sp. TMWB2A]|uniref:GNAT family N-acetyltransferase n=1 Tax=Pseudonocardia sp. TMWB2A TaxID=687430 RepID=UPI003FCF26A4